MQFHSKTEKLTATAMLAATALIIWVVEAQFPAFVPVPGVKLGLSNAVTLFALFAVSPSCAVAVFAVRSILGAILGGNIIASLFGFSGGILALALAVILKKHFGSDQIWILSVLMAIVHNIGQISAAALLTHTLGIFGFLPVLVISGIVTGAITGILVQLLVKRMAKNLY